MDTVYYHGTNFDFIHFDSQFLGRSCNNPTTRFGFFFSDNFDDAFYWAQKGGKRSFTQAYCPLRMVLAHLDIQKTLTLSYDQFYYYLQSARASTIEKHLAQWKAQDYDSMNVIRQGHLWTAVFNPENITVLSNELVEPVCV